MTTISTCPDEHELLPIATGEPADDAVMRHVEACPDCRERLDRLRAEVSELSRELGEAMPADATGPEPAAGGEGEQTALFPMVAAPDLRGGPPERPVVIGKYVVVERLGGGQQGDVYRVLQPNLRKEMVLKLARRPVVGAERTTFFDEVQVLVDLEHINLVRVFDSGLHDDRPFLVMEYVHGRNLEDYARDETVTPRRAAELVARLARALALVHRRGVIHRDIKPQNILIDEASEPRLIDFGLARLRNAWSDPFANTWGGTLPYMAPEQARLEHDRIGTRSDIFGLGAVLFFLLTGRPPFAGATRDEVWDRAQRGEFEAGALRAAGVPRRLERICLKALAADPADRYPSAEAFEKALRHYLIRPKVLGVLSGVCGLVLLGSLVFARVGGRPDLTAWPGPQPPIPTAPPAPGSLVGDLTIRVWSKEGGGKRGLKIDEPGALPLLAGERVHIEARLNRPAHAYLLWLDGQGHASLLYPRDDGKFGSGPPGGPARETFHSPAALDEGHRMTGPGGLETVLLLARRTPLPPGIDLAGLVGPLPSSPLRDEREFATRGFDEGQPTGGLGVGLHRGIAAEADGIDDPLLQLMERLRKQHDFEVIKVVRFAYRGE
jgi:predicted Ser/Thr protein kinase